jgi:hypothetical protein
MVSSSTNQIQTPQQVLTIINLSVLTILSSWYCVKRV